MRVKKSFNIYSVFWYMIIFILCISRIFAQNNQGNILIILTLGFIFTIFLINLIKLEFNKTKKLTFNSLEITWIIFSITCFTTDALTGELSFKYIVYIVIFLILFRSSFIIDRLIEKVIKMSLLAIIISFIYSIMIYPINIPYRGVYGNPNGTGMIAICGLASILSIMVENIVNKQYKSMYIKIPLIILFIYMIIISDSSTALIIAILLIIVSVIFYCKIRFDFNLMKLFLGSIFIVIISGLIINFTVLRSDVFKSSKLYYKIQRNDIWNGRDDVWISIMNNATLLGHNSQERLRISLYMSEHSDFMAVLNDNGIISLIIYIVFFYVYIYKVIKLFVLKKYNKMKYSIFLILMPIVHICLSVTEDIFGLSLILPAILSTFVISELIKIRI